MNMFQPIDQGDMAEPGYDHYKAWFEIEHYDSQSDNYETMDGTTADRLLPCFATEAEADAWLLACAEYGQTLLLPVKSFDPREGFEPPQLSESTIVGQMVREDHPDDSRGICPKCGDTVYADGSGGVCMSGCYLSSDDIEKALDAGAKP